MKPEETNPWWRPGLPPDVEPGEAEILEAFDDWIHETHPNPERIGCPGRAALFALQTCTGKFEDEYTLTHIGECAACLDELTEIRKDLERAGSA